MIMNNEMKKLSRKRKPRIERKNKIDDKMKTLINTTKTEEKNKNVDKIKDLELELVKIRYANNPNELQFELKELNKIQVVNKNLHEIKNEVLLDCVGEFEMVGNLKAGDQIRQTHIRFRNIAEY